MAELYETLGAATGGEMVGGQLIAMIDGKHTMLGFLSNHQFVLTPEGEAEFEKLTAPAKAVVEGKAKSKDIKLDIVDAVGTEDKLG